MSRPVTPLVAADVIVQLPAHGPRSIVLIERLNPPYGWAIPGGFVDVGEAVEAAAVRELREETQLDVTLTALLGVYSKPGRDPRGHTLSVVYVGTSRDTPQAADDAKSVIVTTLDDLPQPLAFDHQNILNDYRDYLETGRPPSP